MRYEVKVGEDTFMIHVNQEGIIVVDDEQVEVDFAPIGANGLYSLLVDNESFEALAEERDGVWYVQMRGHLYEVDVADERTQLINARAQMTTPESGEIPIKAPMPGLIVSVEVEVGQEVEAGDALIILESMKMENDLKAPRAGRIERVNVAAGDSVDQNQVLVVIV